MQQWRGEPSLDNATSTTPHLNTTSSALTKAQENLTKSSKLEAAATGARRLRRRRHSALNKNRLAWLFGGKTKSKNEYNNKSGDLRSRRSSVNKNLDSGAEYEVNSDKETYEYYPNGDIPTKYPVFGNVTGFSVSNSSINTNLTSLKKNTLLNILYRNSSVSKLNQDFPNDDIELAQNDALQNAVSIYTFYISMTFVKFCCL